MNNIAWILALMVGMGGIGKFVDFYIGKPGRERVKDSLLKGWTKFNDMHWFNFSEVEAQYVVAFMDRFVGAKFFSLKRLLLTLIFPLAAILFVEVHSQLIWTLPCVQSHSHDSFDYVYIGSGLCQIAAFAASFSLSRWLSTVVIRMARWRFLGPIPYLLLLLFHVLLMICWTPNGRFLLTLMTVNVVDVVFGKSADMGFNIHQGLILMEHTVRIWQPSAIRNEIKSAFYIIGYTACPNHLPTIDVILTAVYGAFVGLWRIVTALTFLIAFMLREWLSHFVSTVWARIYEDNDGAFTLIFGGLGAVAGGLKALLS